MAYGDYQSLLPSETAYTSPGAYVNAAKVEAVKRATYLSSMDQFYSQLEESTRQFEETLGFKEKELAQTAELTREEISSRERISSAARETQRWIAGQYVQLGREQAAQTTAYQTGQLGLEERKLEMAETGAKETSSWLDFLKNQYTESSKLEAERLSQSREYAADLRNLFTSSLNKTPTYLQSGPVNIPSSSSSYSGDTYSGGSDWDNWDLY